MKSTSERTLMKKFREIYSLLVLRLFIKENCRIKKRTRSFTSDAAMPIREVYRKEHRTYVGQSIMKILEDMGDFLIAVIGTT